jgi:hypothetical protein
LFDVLAHEAISQLRHFNSQDLTNMLRAHANVNVGVLRSNMSLFEAAGDSIFALDESVDFWPQALSNIAWACATAGESHPLLFHKLADHIVTLKVSGFKPQEMSNIAWAYSTAGKSNPVL